MTKERTHCTNLRIMGFTTDEYRCKMENEVDSNPKLQEKADEFESHGV